MPDWKKLLAEQQIRKHSKDPNRQWSTYAKQGWEKAEKIAAELDCSIPQISVVLRDSLNDKRIERGEFQIWNRDLIMLEKVVGFRKAKPGQQPLQSAKPLKRIKPTAGAKIRSRRGNFGKIIQIERGRCLVKWENGSETRPSVKSFAKGDLVVTEG